MKKTDYKGPITILAVFSPDIDDYLQKSDTNQIDFRLSITCKVQENDVKFLLDAAVANNAKFIVFATDYDLMGYTFYDTIEVVEYLNVLLDARDNEYEHLAEKNQINFSIESEGGVQLNYIKKLMGAIASYNVEPDSNGTEYSVEDNMNLMEYATTCMDTCTDLSNSFKL